MSDIFEAVINNDVNCIKNLVETRGISVTITNYGDQTPAHIAANNGYSDIVRYLVSKDSSLVKMKNKWEQTILHIACLLYTSPSPRDRTRSRMPSSA